MTSAMPLKCSYLLSYEALRYEQVDLLGSCLPVKGIMSERNLDEMWLRDELK